MTYLGVDFGKKRIGFAVGDSTLGLPRPLPVARATGTLVSDASIVLEVAAQHAVHGIVVGVPQHSTELGKSREPIHLQLSELLKGHTYSIHLIDESLSTQESFDILAAYGKTVAWQKRVIDSAAACLILERFFKCHAQE